MIQYKYEKKFLIIIAIIVLISLFLIYFCFQNKSKTDYENEILIEKIEEENGFSREDALEIAKGSEECVEAGILTGEIVHNEITKTWWIDLKMRPETIHAGCSPACVVNEISKEAEVNWRCTGSVVKEIN